MANNTSMAVNNEVIVLDGGGGVGADPITTSTTDRGAGSQLTKWSIGTYILIQAFSKELSLFLFKFTLYSTN